MHRYRLAGIFVCIVALSGCSWQQYVGARAVRTLTGSKLRYHSLTPLNDTLDRYRIIEVRQLDNEVLDQIPVSLEKYLNDRIASELKAVNTAPAIRSSAGADTQDGPAQPTLVLSGAIQDYDPGYFGLRLVEFGFNHIAVTITFELRDKQTGDLLASGSVTAQDDRATPSPKSAINKIARRIRNAVDAGYRIKP